jgi:hypothetical protein
MVVTGLPILFVSSDVSSAGMGLLLSVALVIGSVQAVLDIVLLLLGAERGAEGIPANQQLTLPSRSVDVLLRIAQSMPEHEIKLQAKRVSSAHQCASTRLLIIPSCALSAVRAG